MTHKATPRWWGAIGVAAVLGVTACAPGSGSVEPEDTAGADEISTDIGDAEITEFDGDASTPPANGIPDEESVE